MELAQSSAAELLWSSNAMLMRSVWNSGCARSSSGARMELKWSSQRSSRGARAELTWSTRGA
eukprot:7344946-Alexandrium_andersonii.AAC.2